MNVNEIPKMNMDTNETGCCPKFNPEPWNDKEIEFKDKLFVKANTINFLHIPLNMGSMYKKICAKLKQEDAEMKDNYLVLSYDPSPWKGEHYFAVEKDISGEEMARLSGKYLTKVFEEPYKEAGTWVKKMDEFVKSKDKKTKKLYFFYTTCPKCLKHYGKNYVVAFAEV
jgi:hypothetical protein